MSTSFYNVQIPYTGMIPVINRRGPVREAMLSKEQINELLALGVEIVDAANGKPFHFPAPVAHGDIAASTKEEAMEMATAKVVEPPVVSPSASEDDSSNDRAHDDPDEVSEDAVVQPDEPIGDPTQKTVSAISYFDPSKIENFDQLSKNKQRKIRKAFAESLGTFAPGTDPSDEDVAKAYEAAKALLVTDAN